MSGKSEHKAIVDKGLKMKIKRKSSTGTKSELKHEIVASAAGKAKGDVSCGLEQQSVNGHFLSEEEETKPLEVGSKTHAKVAKSGKQKSKKGRKSKGGSSERQTDTERVNSMLNKGRVLVTLNRLDASEMRSPSKTSAAAEDTTNSTRCDRGIAGFTAKKPTALKVEDWSAAGPALPANKNEVGVVTEPECLGPCEPGTNVTLEGIVWTETDHGMLVVNVTWRGKTYIGTLLDAGQDEWAPPSFGAEAEARATKGRGRRPRGAAAGAEALVLSGARRLRNRKIFAPSSPARAEDTSLLGKRKGQQTPQNTLKEDSTPAKRARSSCDGESSQNPGSAVMKAATVPLIECPEEGCQKKYQHANGLRYHQAHAHRHSIHTIQNSQIYGPKDSVSEDRPKPLPVTVSAHKKHRKLSPVSQTKILEPATPATPPGSKPTAKLTTSSSDRDNKHAVSLPAAQTNDQQLSESAPSRADHWPALTIKQEKKPNCTALSHTQTSHAQHTAVSNTPCVPDQKPTTEKTPVSTSQHASLPSQNALVSLTNQISACDQVTRPVLSVAGQSSQSGSSPTVVGSSQSTFTGPVLPPVSAKFTSMTAFTAAGQSNQTFKDCSSTMTNMDKSHKMHNTDKVKDPPQILNVPSSSSMLLSPKDNKDGERLPVTQLPSPLGYPFMERKEAARFGGPAVFHSSSAEATGRGLDLSLKSPQLVGNSCASSSASTPADLGPPHLEPMVYKTPEEKKPLDCLVTDNRDIATTPATNEPSLSSPSVKSESVQDSHNVHSPHCSGSESKDSSYHINLAPRSSHLLVPKLPQRSHASTDLVKKSSSSDTDTVKKLASPSEAKPLLKSLVVPENMPHRAMSPGQQSADLHKVKGQMEVRTPSVPSDLRARTSADARLAERQYHIQKYVQFQQQKIMEQHHQQHHQQQQQHHHKHGSPLTSPQMEQWLHENSSRAHEAAKLAAHLQNGGSMFQGSSELHKLLIHDERMSLSPPVSRGLTTPPGMPNTSIPMSVAMSPVSTAWHHPHHPGMMSKVPHLARGQLLQNGAVYSGNPVHGNAMAAGRYLSATDSPRYPGAGSPQLPISRPL